MSSSTDAKAVKASKAQEEGEKEAFVDFTAFSSSALHSYVSYYDLAQAYPPPDTTASASASGSGSSSRKGRRGSTRAGSPTLASRKRTADAAGLDPTTTTSSAASGSAKAAANGSSSGSSSSSKMEDDPPCPPHFFDADAAGIYLSQVAAKHFASQPAPKEGEVVVGFLYKCKAKGELNRPLAHHRIRNANGSNAAPVARQGTATAGGAARQAK